MVGTDGSKEGWEDSNRGDKNRERFKMFITDKGENFEVKFIEIECFGDGGENGVVCHN